MTQDRPDILYVITDLRLGGVPLHVLRLVQAMRGNGLSVAVVSLAPGGEVADMLRAEGVRVLDCGGRGGWDVRVIYRLARMIRQFQPKLVHSLLFHANLAARVAGRLVAYPAERILCEIQTVEIERRWHLWVDHATHEWCRFTIGNSPSVVEHLHRAAGIPLSRLRLVRGGIEVSSAPELSTAGRKAVAGLPQHVPIVLWVGRLDPVKGLSVLLRAFQRVVGRSAAHLVLAGEGTLRAALEREVVELGLQGRVHLLGARRDVPDLLCGADLFVFPSRTEGLPNALLEAMRAGLPIVTTDVPGCRDLIRHGDTGLVVAYDDASALGDSIMTLLNDRAAAGALGKRARAEVASAWTLARTHADYLSLYRAIMSN